MKSLSKHITLLSLLALGLFLMPNESYACSKTDTKMEKSSCSKNQSKTSTHKHHSCKDKSCKKGNNSNDCGGCAGSSCRCGKYCGNSLNVPIIIGLGLKYPTANARKQIFGFKQAYYSSGFLSIWLPPKIS